MNAITTTQQAPALAATVLREFEADFIIAANRAPGYPSLPGTGRIAAHPCHP